jgi:hypothetical protein
VEGDEREGALTSTQTGPDVEGDEREEALTSTQTGPDVEGDEREEALTSTQTGPDVERRDEEESSLFLSPSVSTLSRCSGLTPFGGYAVAEQSS